MLYAVSEGSDECGGEYAVAEWGEQREMRCAGQASEWLQNRIFPGNLKVHQTISHCEQALLILWLCAGDPEVTSRGQLCQKLQTEHCLL